MCVKNQCNLFVTSIAKNIIYVNNLLLFKFSALSIRFLYYFKLFKINTIVLDNRLACKKIIRFYK